MAKEQEKPNSIGAVQKREIVEEMKGSYIDYAMSVIVARALPDVRDGLKPVHRRILYAMHEDGLAHTAKYRKSATVIGSVLGRFHPHGDMAVYDALARMAQDFSLRYPLIDGQGNWGSIDGDSPAAYRYCVTGDTLVVTNKGLQRIGDISKKENLAGVSVLSHARSVNQASKWFDSGIHPTKKVTTFKGYSIQGSLNHPLLTMVQDSQGKPTLRWKVLSEVEEGDIVALDRSRDILWPTQEVDLNPYIPSWHNARGVRKLPQHLTADLAFLLGGFLSEGSITKEKAEFCNTDRAWITDIQRRWNRLFPDSTLHMFERKPSSYGKKPYARLECHWDHTLAFLRNIGLEPVKSSYRRIPSLIFQSPKSVVAAFLRAYFEGDGGTILGSKRFDLFCCSASKELLQGMQTLLLRFGIDGFLRYDASRKLHVLQIRGVHNLKLFQEEIGFISERKQRKLSTYLASIEKEFSKTDYIPFLSSYVRGAFEGYENTVYRYNFDRYEHLDQKGPTIAEITLQKTGLNVEPLFAELLQNHYLFEQIVKVEDAGEARVYSFRVDSKCHSYVGNGFVNHNTECRMSRMGEETLHDIAKNTVDFVENYDGTRKEPTVLPSPVPQLLLNGTLGIAVGMATNIPPHNLSELVDALLYLVKHPKATTPDLFEFLQGPDFPTGGIIFNKQEILSAYSQGKGPIVMRGKVDIQETEKKTQIIISEIPYQVTKSTLVEQFAKLVQEKKIDGIKDIRDESDKDGLRIVFDLQQAAAPQKIVNRLYKFSDLQKTFHLNMLALVDGIQPKVLSLAEVLSYFLDHRRQVVTRRTQFELDKAKERAHILEGLYKCLSNIDKVIQLIKKSADREDAKRNLMKAFTLTEIQAHAILEMRLAQLAKLERQKIEEELQQIKARIKELLAILADPKKIDQIVVQELQEVKQIFGDNRKTKVQVQGVGDIAEEDLIPQEETIITLTQGGYIKRINPATYKIQKRGGKGIVGMKTVSEDIIEHFLYCNTHDSLMVFTDSGKVFQIPVYEIPEGTRVAKGRGLLNFVELSPQDKVLTLFALGKKDADESIQNLVMLTKNGIMKKTALQEFQHVRKSGLIAITLKKGDSLQSVRKTTGQDEVIIATKKGQAIRFQEKDVRTMGRSAAGIHAIRLKKGDEVVSMDIIRTSTTNAYFLTLCENGYGKKTDIKEYRLQSRGGSGIKTANVTPKTGNVVYAKSLTDEEELIVISRKGQVIRTEIESIAKISRSTQGVRIMRLDEGDKVASAACM